MIVAGLCNTSMTFVGRNGRRYVAVVSPDTRGSASWRRTSGHSFTCPNCNALYRLVRQEAGPETINREVTCRAWTSAHQKRD
jgi:hypothetical protein